MAERWKAWKSKSRISHFPTGLLVGFERRKKQKAADCVGEEKGTLLSR